MKTINDIINYMVWGIPKCCNYNNCAYCGKYNFCAVDIMFIALDYIKREGTI